MSIPMVWYMTFWPFRRAALWRWRTGRQRLLAGLHRFIMVWLFIELSALGYLGGLRRAAEQADVRRPPEHDHRGLRGLGRDPRRRLGDPPRLTGPSAVGQSRSESTDASRRGPRRPRRPAEAGRWRRLRTPLRISRTSSNGRWSRSFWKAGSSSCSSGRAMFPSVLGVLSRAWWPRTSRVGGRARRVHPGTAPGGPASRCGSCPSGRESNPYLSQIERGLRKPSAEILRQIARALEISLGRVVRPGGNLGRAGRRSWDLVGEIRLYPPRVRRRPIHIYQSFRHEAAETEAESNSATVLRSPATQAACNDGRSVPHDRSRGPLDPHAARPSWGGRQRRAQRLRARAGLVARAGGRLLHRLHALATWPAGRHRRRARVHRGPRGRGLEGLGKADLPACSKTSPARCSRPSSTRPDALFAHYCCRGGRAPAQARSSTCR